MFKFRRFQVVPPPPPPSSPHYLLFSAAEQLSLSLQKKNIAIQDALSAVEAAKEHFKHLRSDEEFNVFYEKALRFAEEKGIEQPWLP